MVNDIWVEVNKTNLIHNYRTLRNYINKDAKFCAVLKANAYGHDLVQTAKVLSEENVDYFGLTHLDEALEVRHAGVDTPILLFMPVTESRIKEAICHNVELTCASLFDAKNICKVAENINKDAHIHIKVETGMGRLGVLQSEIFELFDYINEHERLKVISTYTHFTQSGDINVRWTHNQYKIFAQITELLKKRGYDIGFVHCANSAATLRFQEYQLGMVRCGTILFGQFPSAYAKVEGVNLKPTWQLKARVVAVRHLLTGSTVGYGSEYSTNRDTKTAVVACGFSHGYTLMPESLIYRIEPIRYFMKKYFRKQTMKIKGKEYPVIGRVSMQMTVLDITDAKEEIKVNDEVVIPTMRLPVQATIPRIFVD